MKRLFVYVAVLMMACISVSCEPEEARPWHPEKTQIYQALHISQGEYRIERKMITCSVNRRTIMTERRKHNAAFPHWADVYKVTPIRRDSVNIESIPIRGVGIMFGNPIYMDYDELCSLISFLQNKDTYVLNNVTARPIQSSYLFRMKEGLSFELGTTNYLIARGKSSSLYSSDILLPFLEECKEELDRL